MRWPVFVHRQRRARLGAAVGMALLACWACAAMAQNKPAAAPPLPAAVAQRNLVVELRTQPQGGANVVSTRSAAEPTWAPQAVRVKNGQEASLSLGSTVHVQWVQAAAVQGATRSSGASGGSASSAGGAVVNAMTALPTGQGLTVKPRWLGGRQPVTVELAVRQAGLDTSTGAAVPVQTNAQLNTTVSLPLGEWVTIAATGAPDQPGVYSSRAAAQVPQALQLRVTAP